IPSHYPTPGKPFTVEAHIPGLEPVWATDTLPQRSRVYKWTYGPAGFKDEHGDGVSVANVHFKDAPEIPDFYEISFFYASPFWADKFYVHYVYILFQINAILQNEGDHDYEPLSYFFSDELFNGKDSIDFEVFFRPYSSSGEPLDHPPYHVPEEGRYILFRDISRNYYEYLKARTRHRHTQVVGQGVSNPEDIILE
ncbi:MAG: DUF4249 family protein, partial [bacterium]|nr:DUF4249 family protein [bacterium]